MGVSTQCGCSNKCNSIFVVISVSGFPRPLNPDMPFSSLMDDLTARVRVPCVLKADISSPTFQEVPRPSPLQAKAYQLFASYPVINFFYRLINQHITV
jgi:hypothetical protein